MRIFVYYCSFGEPLNTNKLRSTKFIKLLRDSKMLETKPQDRSKAGGNTGYKATGQQTKTLRRQASEQNQIS